MNITIKIHTNPGATYEDLSCALERIQQRVDQDEDRDVQEGDHFYVKMDGLPVADVMIVVEP